jgi:hypothetical protein
MKREFVLNLMTLGISGWEIISNTSLSTSVDKSISASCTGSKKIIGGGGYISPISQNLAIQSSYPPSNNSWMVTAVEASNENSNWIVTAYAICANVT